MQLLATAVFFLLMTPGPGVAAISLLTSPRVTAPSPGLGYAGEQGDQVAAAARGDAVAAIRLGDWELEHGGTARAHAWFEYGTRLGSVDAQDHLVWLQPFMDDGRREDASAFGAEIALAFGLAGVPNS